MRRDRSSAPDEEIGLLARDRGLISDSDLAECLEERRRTTWPMAQILLRRGLVKSSQLAELLRESRDRRSSTGGSGSPAAPPPSPFGESLGRYRIVRELARGGMGVVYEAIDPELRRKVALKVLPITTTKNVKRFQREAAVAARLHHPHVVPIHEIGTVESPGGAGPVHFLAMDLVEGPSLEEVLAELPLESAVRYLAQVCQAIGHAHAHGVVHRDLKPANILLAGDRALVTDFGIALDPEARTRLTRTGVAVGTLHYQAPEQVRIDRRAIGPTTDVWALGVVLYRILSGAMPFPGKSSGDVQMRILSAEPDWAAGRVADCPRDLRAVCQKALEKGAGRRYPDAGQMGLDLERWLAGESVSARPVSGIVRLGRRVRARPAVPATVACLAIVAAVAGWSVWERARTRSSLDEARHRGDRAFEAQDWSEALVAYERSLAIEADAAVAERAAICRGRLADNANRDDEASRRRRAWEAIEPIAERIDAIHGLTYVRSVDPAPRVRELLAAIREIESISVRPEFADVPRISRALGIASHHVGRWEAASTHLQRAEALDPEDGTTQYYLGRNYLMAAVRELVLPGSARDQARAAGWFERAAEYLARADSIRGRTEPLESDLVAAFLALARGDRAAAAEACRAGLEVHRGALGIEDFHLVLGWIAGSKDPERERQWEAALAIRPHHAVVLFLLADHRCRAGRFEDALTLYDATLALHPDEAHAHCHRGVAAKALGRLDEALADCDRALELDPGMAIAHSNRGASLEARGDFDLARRAFDRALELDAGCVHALLGRANVLTRLGRHDLALPDLERLIELDPANGLGLTARAHVNRGNRRQDLADRRGALADYDRAIQLDPDFALAWNNRGNWYLDEKRPDRARADYERAVELEPGSSEYVENRGIARAMGGDASGADLDYARAIEIDPSRASAWFNRGTLHLSSDPAGAAAYLRRAVELAPRNWRPRYYHAIALANSGSRPEAAAEFRKALELSPPDDIRTHIEATLRRIGG